MFFERNIEGQYIETYKTFAVTLDNTKLKLSMCNDSVKPNKKKILRGMVWIVKKHLRIKNNQVAIKKEKISNY